MAESLRKEMANLSMDISAEAGDEREELDCRTFFRSYVENGKTHSDCLVANCRKKKLVGKQKFNLERHLAKVHGMNFVHHTPVLPNKQVPLKIKMDPAMVYKAFVENWAVNGRPLRSVNDGGMRKLVNPILQAFEKSGVHLDLSIPTVKSYMVKYTAALKGEIMKEVQNQIIHVKLDIASKNRKSVLGINVQFMKADQIVVRTLAMIRTNASHTGEYICSLLMQTLDDYNIKYTQVHTITADNGKNVVKSVELFGDVKQFDWCESDDLDLDQFFDECPADERETEEEDIEDGDTEEEIDQIDALLHSAASLFARNSKIHGSGLRCAAHTLQLVLNIALKKTGYSLKLIEKCRRAVRFLLKPNISNLIRQQNYKMPMIDCLTRWSSTFHMLKRLVELKPFYEQWISVMPSNCKLSNSDWLNLDGILKILSLFDVATTKLQAVNFTVADFYHAWHELKIELESLAGMELVDNILRQMEIRNAELLRNEVVYSCVFMDPRYRILLTEGINLFIVHCLCVAYAYLGKMYTSFYCR